MHRRICEARTNGGVILLVGNSSVGKTRLLYEMARDVLADFFVLAPERGDGGLVNAVAEAEFRLPKMIVWLDALERFLDGPYLTTGDVALTATAIRQLLNAPTPMVILGTLRPENVERLRRRVGCDYGTAPTSAPKGR